MSEFVSLSLLGNAVMGIGQPKSQFAHFEFMVTKSTLSLMNVRNKVDTKYLGRAKMMFAMPRDNIWKNIFSRPGKSQRMVGLIRKSLKWVQEPEKSQGLLK